MLESARGVDENICSKQMLFVAGSLDNGRLMSGWAHSEEAFTWTIGMSALLSLPDLPDSDLAILINISHVAGVMQRVIVKINNNLIGNLYLSRPGELSLFIPRSYLVQSADHVLEFGLPDAVAPCDISSSLDSRILGIAVSSICIEGINRNNKLDKNFKKISDYEIMMEVCSLGINCELGFAQRAVGAEPIGLFRWAYCPLEILVNILNKKFVDIAKPEYMRVWSNADGEFFVEDQTYNLRYHTFLFSSKDVDASIVINREAKRIPYLARKLIEDLEEGGKLFVYHDAGLSKINSVIHIRDAIRIYNPNNYLLWVCPALDKDCAGSVDLICDGIITGYLDEFQPINGVKWASVSCWISLARGALTLRRSRVMT
jgi:hypothetical protein